MRIKKSVFVSLLVICSLIFGSIGVFAASGVEAIKAALNHNIRFVLDGANWSPKDSEGNKMSALVYNGSTYVPLRAVSEALNAEIDWDNKTSTITINKDNSNFGIPYNDDTDGNNSGNNKLEAPVTTTPTTPAPAPSPAPNTTSSNSGRTMDNAVPYGKSITYTDPYSYDGLSYTGDYTVSVTSAKPITRSQIADLGFKEPEANSLVDYRLVKLKISLKNGKVITDEENLNYYVSTILYPSIWGSKSSDGRSIIGGTNYGFEGSLRDAISDAGDRKIVVGKTESYTVEGSLLLPITKGSTNFLTLQLKDTSDYNNSFFYFALE